MIGIIIPYYNLSWMTINCLSSIKDSGGRYHIYLMNNGSKQIERDSCDRFLQDNFNDYTHFDFDKNTGFVVATNKGIELCLNDGLETFVMLNNDTLVTFGWLERLYKSIESEAYMAGPMSSPPNWRELNQSNMLIEKKVPYKQIKQSMEGFSTQVRVQFEGVEKEVEFLPFFCTMFNSKIVDKIGYLKEDYKLGLFDDNDYCHLALQKGLKMVLRKDVYVHHYHRSTWIDNKMDYHKLLEENRKKFIKLHGFDPWEGL